MFRAIQTSWMARSRAAHPKLSLRKCFSRAQSSRDTEPRIQRESTRTSIIFYHMPRNESLFFIKLIETLQHPQGNVFWDLMH